VVHTVLEAEVETLAGPNGRHDPARRTVRQGDAKTLAAAIRAVFDHPVIARCQAHKVSNVRRRHPPDKVASVVEARIRAS
jgi:hypothetical protein